MGVPHVLALSLAALLIGRLSERPTTKRYALPAMLLVSLVVLYALQPATPLRYLDFWAPTLSLFLVITVWLVAQPSSPPDARTTWISLALLASFVVLISLARFLPALCCLTATRPPPPQFVLPPLLVAMGLWALLFAYGSLRRWGVRLLFAILIGLFIIIKTPSLAHSASQMLRTFGGQDPSLAASDDLTWLGFSYLAFRLIHVLRERQGGRLERPALLPFATYALFFPTLLAGPIDRWPRWEGERSKLLQPNPAQAPPSAERALLTVQGLRRVLVGLFKKFALADTLAIIALNPTNAAQVTSPLWMWVLLLAFGLRLYWDFSGYTDIAIGLGNLMGFSLPENFDRPYQKTNLTAFWNSWHITLAQWFRAYVFNPLTRALRLRGHLPVWLIILSGQLITMGLIGVWHGVTWNFLIWGLWHGVGLFVHNRWSDWLRPRFPSLENRPWLKLLVNYSSWALTFLYVNLGWVWFALPEPALAWQVLRTLFGF